MKRSGKRRAGRSKEQRARPREKPHGQHRATRSETHSFRNPLAAKQHVHFLQRQPLRLGHEEPNEGAASKRQEPEEDKGPKGDLLQHDGRDLADDEVGHPVRRRAERDAVGAVGQGPHLADDDPAAGAPAVAKVDDEEPDHADGRPAGRLVRGPPVLVDAEEDGDDGVADAHGHGAGEQDGFPAQPVDVEDGGDGGEEHGDADDPCCEEAGGVARGAQGGEYGRGVVKDGVDTCSLFLRWNYISSMQRALIPVNCWKNMVTVATMTRRNMALVLKSEPMATNCSLKVFPEVGSTRCGHWLAVVRFSKTDCALISRNSSSISSWFWLRFRRLDKTWRASVSRP